MALIFELKGLVAVVTLFFCLFQYMHSESHSQIVQYSHSSPFAEASLHALACCEAGPSSNLSSASQGGFSPLSTNATRKVEGFELALRKKNA
jgi:hypothetical protein